MGHRCCAHTWVPPRGACAPFWVPLSFVFRLFQQNLFLSFFCNVHFVFKGGKSVIYRAKEKSYRRSFKVPLIRTQREKSELKNKIYIKTLPETCTSVDPETVV